MSVVVVVAVRLVSNCHPFVLIRSFIAPVGAVHKDRGAVAVHEVGDEEGGLQQLVQVEHPPRALRLFYVK